jgi:hypothetical protein
MQVDFIIGAVCLVLSIPFFLFSRFAPDWIFKTQRFQDSLMGSLSIRTSRAVFAGFGGFWVLLAILEAPGIARSILS